MPYKYRSAASRTEYRNRKPGGYVLHWERIYTEIATPVLAAMRIVADSTLDMARNRAPVRKVFSVDRDLRSRRLTFRTLSIAELQQETPAFMRTQRVSTKAGMSLFRGVPTFRVGTRTTVGRNTNRANTWKTTEADRRVVMLPPFRVGSHGQAIPSSKTTFELVDLLAQERLNKEGRRVLRQANLVENKRTGALRDRGRGGLLVETVREEGGVVAGYDIHLGGNLRASIHQVSMATSKGPAVFIIAGGKRAPYAKYMEFGTRYVAARPFLRPALKHAERRLPQQVRSALKRRFPQ